MRETYEKNYCSFFLFSACLLSTFELYLRSYFNFFLFFFFLFISTQFWAVFKISSLSRREVSLKSITKLQEIELIKTCKNTASKNVI